MNITRKYITNQFLIPLDYHLLLKIYAGAKGMKLNQVLAEILKDQVDSPKFDFCREVVAKTPPK